MKLLRSFLIAVVLAVTTLGLYMASYLGAFKGVDISESEQGPFKLVYKDHTGSYHKIVSAIEQVEAWARENKIDCTQSFGEYLDDAKTVEESRLRSRGGCIVTEVPQVLPEGFQYRELPARRYVVATFEGSPGIGPLKVYPKVEDFMKERTLTIEGPVIEIYVIHNQKAMTTTYLFPTANALPKPTE